MTHEFDCSQEGRQFAARSDGEGEVIHAAREHATERHAWSISDKGFRTATYAARTARPARSATNASEKRPKREE